MEKVSEIKSVGQTMTEAKTFPASSELAAWNEWMKELGRVSLDFYGNEDVKISPAEVQQKAKLEVKISEEGKEKVEDGGTKPFDAFRRCLEDELKAQKSNYDSLRPSIRPSPMEEAKSLARQFKCVSGNLDGNEHGEKRKISPAEFQQRIEANFGVKISEECARAFIENIEKIGDGGISAYDAFILLVKDELKAQNLVVEPKALNCDTFLGFVRWSLMNIPPKIHGFGLVTFFGLVAYFVRYSTIPFEAIAEETTVLQQQSLTLKDALCPFFPVIADMAKFSICYASAWGLVAPLRPVLQMTMGPPLSIAPLFYYSELAIKASAFGIDVAVGGSCKLTLMMFCTIGAFGITLAYGILIFMMFYLLWRFIYRKNPTRGKDIEVGSEF